MSDNLRMIEKFIKEVMIIEKKYSNEQKNQKSNRIDDIRKCVEKFAVQEQSNENK